MHKGKKLLPQNSLAREPRPAYHQRGNTTVPSGGTTFYLIDAQGKGR